MLISWLEQSDSNECLAKRDAPYEEDIRLALGLAIDLLHGHLLNLVAAFNDGPIKPKSVHAAELTIFVVEGLDVHSLDVIERDLMEPCVDHEPLGLANLNGTS
jgi:hypothetical protein